MLLEVIIEFNRIIKYRYLYIDTIKEYQYTEIKSMSIYLQQLVLIFKIPDTIVSKIY